MYTQGFDNEKYLKLQSEHIRRRIDQFGGKLYLEFGGKLFDDNHASRVLPGFRPDSKLQMLLKLKDQAEIVIAISASDIERNKIRGDLGITYDVDVLRLIDSFRSVGLYVGSVALTHYEDQSSAKAFIRKLGNLGIPVYKLRLIPDYPQNVDLILSDEGFGANDYIETKRELVIVTAPGPGSGKMVTCLSQLYHEFKRGIAAGYAKFETFPVWNLPIDHPVNHAYEAATADLNDVNMPDPYHFSAYGKEAVNYNRDIEVFPVLNAIFKGIYGTSPYKSPTDMGVNMVGCCICDDEECRRASRQEIIRRFYATMCAVKRGSMNTKAISKIQLLMRNDNITVAERPVIEAAQNKAQQTGVPATAIQLEDGTVITGKRSNLLRATSAMMLNALKYLAGIADEIDLLPKEIIQPISDLKMGYLGSSNPRLNLDEILQALSLVAVNDEKAAAALAQLKKLKHCEMHSSVILSGEDDRTLKALGINVTCEPEHESSKLYQI